MDQDVPLRPLFFQRKTHKAGAQHSLCRLMTHPRMVEQRPLLVCEDDGWLAGASAERGVEVIRLPFPGRTSWIDRFVRHGRFARRLAEELRRRDAQPRVVHGNTHSESRIGRAVADRLGVPLLLTLRDPELTGAQFRKHGCERADLVIVNGPWMRDHVAPWTRTRIAVVNNGMAVEEFRPPPPPADRPRRLLVIGDTTPRKGLADFLDALAHADDPALFEGIAFHFPTDRPDWLEDHLSTLTAAGVEPDQLRFIGHQRDFFGCLAGADLVIHPSRAESVGMAALEAIAVGVPLLSSRTGVLPDVLRADHLLFAPANPTDLADRLKETLNRWPDIDFHREAAQARVREMFSLDRTVADLLAHYRTASSDPPG